MSVKPSKITPGSNLLWESSRMMLPEHVAMLQKRKAEQRKKKKPKLADQTLEELAYKIDFLYHQGETGEITVCKEDQLAVFTGEIIQVDVDHKRLKLAFRKQGSQQAMWIDFADILEIDSPFF